MKKKKSKEEIKDEVKEEVKEGLKEKEEAAITAETGAIEESESGSKISPIVIALIAIVVVIVAIVSVMAFRVQRLKAQLQLGDKYMESEDYDNAISAYQKALVVYPTSADAYLGLAEASIGKGELTEAVNILEQGIEITGSENLKQSREVIKDQVFETYVLNTYLINFLPEDTEQVEVIIRSEDMHFGVEWKSSDETIATIDENGLVTGVGEGTTTIVATIGNDTWGYRDLDCTVIVGVVKTYLEEQGCAYVTDPHGLTAPGFAYQMDEKNLRKYDGGLEVEQQDAIYDLISCKISDPDSDGNVTYDVVYTVTVPAKFGIVPDTREAKHEWYFNAVADDMFLCDDYTGQVFAEQDLFGEDDVVYDSTVNWNNLTFDITGKVSSEWVEDEEWDINFSPLTSITWATAKTVGTYTLQVKVPKEYTGLVLALDKRGINDYVDPEYDEEYDPDAVYTDTQFFDAREDGSVPNADEFYLIKLSEFAE